jgi:hypothetical protein
MTTLFTIDLETNDLSQFTSSSTDGGHLSVAAGAALHGTYGMSALVADTNAMYGVKEVTQVANIRFRFYFDPNSISIPNTTGLQILGLNKGGGSFWTFTEFVLNYYTATGYQLFVRVRADIDVTHATDTLDITDVPHCVEANLVRATTAISADGTFQWWVDGVDQGTMTGIDNYNTMIDQNWNMFLGPQGIPASAAGTIYFDDFTANDTGAAIGLITTSAAVPVYMDQYRQRRA